MEYLKKYTNVIDLKQVTERNVNGKSFLEILSIAFQKVELTRLTTIQEYVEHILLTEEYNNTETFIKDHKPVLKEFDMKNEVQLTYLLFTFAAVANKYEVSLKNYINKIIQEQVAQFESTELANNTPVSTQNSKKSSTKLNTKAIPYTPKGKGHTVTFAEIVSRNLDVGSNHDTSPTPSSNRLKMNVTKRIVSDIKEGIITIERVEGAVDFIEWRIKTGQTKSTNRIDDIVKLTEKGEELVKQIEAGVKKDKLCWFWVIYCAEMVILVNMNVVELVNT
ncbi:hypothetical protein RhiirA1_510458 [Rhizophagus irregularis]|uniref:Uncharacterized protein n=1 Tax=Rhizophagus irregularis TaxID=588596 RepID=A0A2N0RV37_9GLOM|nr:hypothetical protein RhiirA1_510458 [Rhizophagus irregularis]